MKIALDIDYTNTRHTEFFAVITEALVSNGHEVFIITFRQEFAQAKADLAN